MVKQNRLMPIGAMLLSLCLFATSCAANAAAPDASASQPANVPDASVSEVVENTDGPVTVYLVRHGETITNASSRQVSGQSSAPLTDEGREVAYYLGIGLANIPFKSAYSSTLFRTHETASIILAENQTSARDLPIHQVYDMREIDMGDFEYITQAEAIEAGIMSRYAREVADNCHEKDTSGTAENYEMFEARAWENINKICAEEAKDGGGNILVVAHGMVNSAIARYISAEDATGVLQNSAVIMLEYNDGEMALKSWNDTSYIEAAQERAANPTPVTLHLVTSGETETDVKGRFVNLIDSGLTEGGRQALETLGQQLGADGFTAVYSADQWKDQASADALISGSALPMQVAHPSRLLRGPNLGLVEGELLSNLPELPEDASAKQRLEIYAAADTTEANESYETATARLTAEYRSICEDIYGKGGGVIAVVSSEMAQQLAAEALTGVPCTMQLGKGGVITLQFDGTSFTIAE